jgi:hypothetical protein
MSSRSLRPPRTAALWLAAWVLCWAALGLCPHTGHAYDDSIATFGDSQSSPKDNRSGGDPDGVGLGTPVPPHGAPPFAPEEPHDTGRSLSPDALRLWILQLLIDIAI